MVDDNRYTFNCLVNTSIWFSTQPNVSLPEPHKQTLIAERSRYPALQRRLVYASCLLNEYAKKDLISFATTYRID